MRSATLLFLLIDLGTARVLGAQAWVSTGAPVARHDATATLLPDDKVLLAGGSAGTPLADAELYDPANGTWVPTGALIEARSHHTATLLPTGRVLVVGGQGSAGALASAELYDRATGIWTSTGSLASPRHTHTATLLADGRVLVAGGEAGAALAGAEIYDPATGTWAATGSLAEARQAHTASLLADGRVLVAGGESSTVLASAELYDPVTGNWSLTTPLAEARARHLSTRLVDGRVLAAGGRDGIPLASAELYDPVTATWSATATLAEGRFSAAAALLPGGEVLVVGGFGSGALATSELYDPVAGTWTPVAPLNAPRSSHTATLLPGGAVLVAGGLDGGALASAEHYQPVSGTWTTESFLLTGRRWHTATMLASGEVLAAGGFRNPSTTLHSAELYDPTSHTWRATGALVIPRQAHTATLLPSGKVLVAGGHATGYLSSAELYDPANETWTTTGSISSARQMSTATLLADGRVLLVGGENNNLYHATNTVEIYDPATRNWTLTASLNTRRYNHTATLLPSGQVLVAGGYDGDESLSSAEIYDPATGTWALTGELSTPRDEHAATLLPDGRVLVSGGSFAGVAILASAELYDPAVGTWSPAGSLAEARYGHTQVLLPDGRLLAVGGNATSRVLTSAELYDTAAGTWSAAGSLSVARSETPVLVLADGRVLAVAGSSLVAQVATSELFEPPGVATERRPVISAISGPLAYGGTAASVTGRRLGGGPEASGGSSNASAVNYPLVQIRSMADGQVSWLVPEAMSGFSEAETTLNLGEPPPGLVPGWNYLTIFRAGVASVAQPVEVVTCGLGITQQPASQTVTVGSAATFQAAAQGARTWQWQRRSEAPVNAAAGGLPQPIDPSPLTSEITVSPPGELTDVTVTVDVDHPRTGDLDLVLVGPEGTRVELASGVGGDGAGFTSTTFDDLAATAITAGSAPFTGSFRPQGLLSQLHGRPAAGTWTLEITDRGGSAAGILRGWSLTLNAWRDVPGATAPSYITPPTAGIDSGTRFRCVAGGACFRLASAPATLTVDDRNEPVAEVLSPRGGEYWLLSPDDGPANTRLVTWAMSDDVRICQVEASLWYSVDGGASYAPAPAGGGLPASFGAGGTCTSPGEGTTSVEYTVPTVPPSGAPGSLYKVRVAVTDHAGLGSTAESPNPFYIVRPNPDSVRTLILANPARMQSEMGLTEERVAALRGKLRELAENPRVQGLVVDLDGITDLSDLYAAWDADRASPEKANNVLFGCHPPFPAGCAEEERDGLHDTIRALLEVYSNVRYLVLVGDDRIVPMARIRDRTALLPESRYPAGGDLTATGTTVGQALAADRYLTDDPLAVVAPIRPDQLDDEVFLPDLALGRLVETPEEIVTTVATFISQDGVLDLSALDLATGHKVLVAGYDFLLDSGRRIRERWKEALGVFTPDDSPEPVDGKLLTPSWGETSIAARRTALRWHLSGQGGGRYAVSSLNGHATHYEAGVPGTDAFDVQGLATSEIFGADACSTPTAGPLSLAGGVLYAVGCHGGLPVPGSCATDAEHSLDLPQTMMSRGVLAYVANTGYGWGLRHGIGYGERLVEIFTEELTLGGTVVLGEAVKKTKERYFLETPRFDVYDAKSVMQWTYFGLPMYAVKTGIVRSSTPAAPAAVAPRAAVEHFGRVVVERQLDLGAPRGRRAALPSYLTQLNLHFDFTASGVYTKRNASGDVLAAAPGCPPPAPGKPAGCYYTLNGLVERATGSADLPVQPYFIYDSRLSGTSQHGVVWKGGIYDEESGWVPVLAELVSNGGDGSNHGSAPRHKISKPGGRVRRPAGGDGSDCRPSDLEVSGLVVPAGEVLKAQDESPTYSIERTYRQVDLEVFYFNNTFGGEGNCDREGPELLAGPYDGDYHRLVGTAVSWAVPAWDEGGVWRVLVVHNDGTVDAAGRGAWIPLELTDDGTGTWRGTLDVTGSPRLTYVLQAIDRHGNVTWLDYVATEIPASGVELDIPLPVDVPVTADTADLAVTLSDAPDPVTADESLTYTIAVSNLGPDTANGVTVSLALPAGAELLSGAGGGWSCQNLGGDLSCTRDSLAAGPAPEVTALARAPAASGNVSATAYVSAAAHDPNPGNNAAAEPTTVLAGDAVADLAITQIAAPWPAIPGESLSWTVTVTNHGPSGVSGARVVDVFAPTLIAPSWSCQAAPGASCTASGAGPLDDTVDLPAAATVTYTATGIVAGAESTITNVAAVAVPADADDPVPGNNSSSLTIPLDRGCEILFDDVEAGDALWLTATGAADTGTDAWRITTSDSHSPASSWFVADEPAVEDQQLVLSVEVNLTDAPAPVLEFWHRFDTEAEWDGGVLEYSSDGGTRWNDILDGDGQNIAPNVGRILEQGYNWIVPPFDNPLADRGVWSGDSLSWRLMRVDLRDFGGTTVFFRWRFGADSAVAGVGWWIDDVKIDLCGSVIFADGFESENLSRWSSVVE